MDIEIYDDRLLITKVESEKKSTLIDIVESEDSMRYAQTGLIVAIGDTVSRKQVGWKVLYRQTDTFPIIFQGVEYLVLREHDVIAKV